jgi:hypothetical protein
MAIGDKKKLYFFIILLFVIGFGFDISAFLSDYYNQSVVEDRVIVVFSPNPQIFADVVKRKGGELLVQTKTVEGEELILFKKNKSFLLLPSKKMYVPINVMDPELITVKFLEQHKDKINNSFKDSVEIIDKGKIVRVFFYRNHISKIEMYNGGIPYKTVTYTYYKETKLNDSNFEIPKDYSLPEKNEAIFDKINEFYDSWCIKLFSPLMIEGFKGEKQSLLIISKNKINDRIIAELKKKFPNYLVSLNLWENFYIISVGNTPFR